MFPRKGQKGHVGISVNRGKLRLTVPRCLGKPVGTYIHLGIDDTPHGRKLAQIKANDLMGDILMDKVDYTFSKYKVIRDRQPQKVETSLALIELCESYFKTKVKSQENTALTTYKNTISHIKKSPHLAKINVLSESVGYAQKLMDNLLSQTSQDMTKRVITQVNAAFKWGIRTGKIPHLEKSPFEGMSTSIKAKKNPEDCTQYAFTKEERDEVINYFKSHPDHRYRHYYGYLMLAFFTGARPSELAALTWGDVNLEKGIINFNKKIIRTEKERKTCNGLKTQNYRIFTINKQLKEILKAIPRGGDSDYLFKTHTGKLMDSTCIFNTTYWRGALAKLGIPYKVPYSTRHTFITLCLKEGSLSLVDVSRLVGNSAQIIEKHYLRFDPTKISIPEL